MLRNGISVLAAAAAALFTPGIMPAADGLLTQKALSADVAQTIAQGALEKCRADGYRVSVTILDANGMLKAFVRDDGTGPHTGDFSRKKAYSAVTFKRTSAETGKAWATQNPPPNIDGTTGTAGGVPIRAGNEVIGSIGVSGAPGGDKDEACANAGIARVADKLK